MREIILDRLVIRITQVSEENLIRSKRILVPNNIFAIEFYNFRFIQTGRRIIYRSQF